MTNRFTALAILGALSCHVRPRNGLHKLKGASPIRTRSRAMATANANLGQAIKLADILGSIYIVVGSQYTIQMGILDVRVFV